MMIGATDIVDTLLQAKFETFSGVPCSLLTPLINGVITHPRVEYIGAASEGEALAIAAGSWLGGKRSVVLCQNAGLGNLVNPLTSLTRTMNIPCLLIITWRGEPGIKDEPQHEHVSKPIDATRSHVALQLIPVAPVDRHISK
jgi:phosphonopyruvate decarboxylase